MVIMRRFNLLICTIFLPLLLMGQEFGMPSLSPFPESLTTLQNPYKNPHYNNYNNNIRNDFQLKELRSIGNTIPISMNFAMQNYHITPNFIFDRNPYARDWNSSGLITTWGSGYLYGAGGYSTFPTIGSIGNASFGITQSFGRLTVSGAISGYKYNLVGGAYNNFGFSGSASYKFNDRFSLNVFGSVQSNNRFYSAAAMSVLPYSSYGASLTTRFSDTFGAELGMQRTFDPFTNSWRNVPIIAPFFNIAGHKVGIDFGGILLDILNTVISNDNQNWGPPGGGNGGGRPATAQPLIMRTSDALFK